MKGKVVIFGGAGFIGSYLTEELLKREYSVIVADIKQNQYTEKAEFVYCDITSPEQIAQAIPRTPIIFIIRRIRQSGTLGQTSGGHRKAQYHG